MLKMEYTLDETKIKQDGIYEVETIRAGVDEMMRSLHLKRIGEGVYSGIGSKDDYANIGSAIILLKREKWFLPYVDKWLYYNGNGSNREEDFVVEDIAKFYCGGAD